MKTRLQNTDPAYMHSAVYEGFVEHKRALPVEHAFRYGVYFYALDLDELSFLDRDVPLFGYNRFRPASIFDTDFLDAGKDTIRQKVLRKLGDQPFASEIARIVLVTTARYFNYVFNPVSFYYVFSARGNLLCVITEVNNTFGEKHLYVLSQRESYESPYPARFSTKKAFHVSPFNNLDGQYRFTLFAISDEIDIRIALERDGQTVFEARLYGNAKPLTGKNHARLLLRHPLTAHLTMPRILLEAARLFFRRKLPYIDKPPAVHMMTLRRRGPSLVERLSMKYALKLLNRIKIGLVTIHLPDHREIRLGDPDSSLQARITVYDYAFFTRVLLGGDVGIGEAYMDGLWDTGDIPCFFSVLIKNRKALADGYPVTACLARWKNRIGHTLRVNTPCGSRRNIGKHYDLSNEFFRNFLDPTMLYSCGIYANASDTCEEAQREKVERIIRMAGIGPADHILEIGCGWGGFAVEAVRQTGCRVTGITISEKQYAFAVERVRQAGLNDRITILLRDYRHVEGIFDKIVSIEMLEAVGHKYLDRYFAACDRTLKPDGKAVIQVITIPDQSYEDYRRETDWIQKYIFPGGHLPSVTALLKAATKSSSLLVEHLEDIGPHYSRTLRDWREQLMKNRDQIQTLGFDESFLRKWTYYLAMCEAGFRERAISDIQIVFRKPA